MVESATFLDALLLFSCNEFRELTEWWKWLKLLYPADLQTRPDKLVSVSGSFRKSPQETEGKRSREKAQAKETFPGVTDASLKLGVLENSSA